MTSQKRARKFHTHVVSQPIRRTTHIWVVLLIGCASREICLNQSEALPRAGCWHIISLKKHKPNIENRWESLGVMLEFYVGYCTLPEICRRYTQILKQLKIFSDNLWAKNLRLKVNALLYVYAKKITQCMLFLSFCTENYAEVREKLLL